MSNDLSGLAQNDGGDIRSFGESLLEPQSPEAAGESEQLREETPTNDGGDEAGERASDAAATEAPEAEAPGQEDVTEDAEAEASGESPEESAEGEEDIFEVPMPDGSTKEMTAAELGQGILLMADYTKKTQALATERQAVEEAQGRLAEQGQARLQRLDAAIGALESHLQASQRSPEEWDRLREEDFAEFDRQREAEMSRRAALQQAHDARVQERQRQLADQIPQERSKLVSSLTGDGFSDWGSPEGFDKEYQRLGHFVVKEFGISPEEWNAVVDHRSIRIAYHAMRNMEASRQAAALPDKIRRREPRRRMRAGSTARPPENPAAVASAKATDRLKKTGRWQDATDALLIPTE